MIPSANWHTGALISRGEPRDEGRERERESDAIYVGQNNE